MPDQETIVAVTGIIEQIDDPETLTILARKCAERAREIYVARLGKGIIVRFKDNRGEVLSGTVVHITDKNVKVMVKGLYNSGTIHNVIPQFVIPGTNP